MSGKSFSNAMTSKALASKVGVLSSCFIPAAVVVGFLFLLISLRNGAEAAMAGVANLLPVGYAFAAGMVASVNPCGFFMLPSYISYLLDAEEAAV